MKTREVAAMLGLRAGRSPVDLVERIEEGLSVDALDRVARRIAPGDANFKYRVVAKATLARRRLHRRLTAEEGDRLARLAGIWQLAVDVWGSEDRARAFLVEPHMLLGGHAPLDMALKTDLGARTVENLLGRLKYGSAA
jgi:putative toxin-antitoxin system antitoxin component (TIGR02293 family)